MTRNINVPLSESDYQRFKRWAEARQQDVGKAIADYLAAHGPNGDETLVLPAAEDPRMAQEKAAYARLHPQLRETHAGQYVAIYEGRLVDQDADYGALFERIEATFPDDFVWLTQVKDEPVGTLHFRSPRLLEDTS